MEDDTAKAEEKLRSSEEKYRVLFESSRDAIMMLAPPDWLFVAGNPATVEMFQAKDEKEFTSTHPWDISPKYQPDGQLSSEKAKKMIEQAVHSGSHFFEWMHKRFGGEEFPATVLLTRIKLGDKTLLQATVRDITSRKRTEQELEKHRKQLEELVEERTAALQESEEKFKALFKKNPAAQVYLDDESRILDINSRFEELFGYTLQEIKGRNINDIVVPQDKLPETINIREKKRKGYFSYETVRTSKQGRRIPVAISGSPIIIGGQRRYLNTYENITERKETEKQLIQSEEKYRTLTDNINVGIYRNTPGPKGTFIEVNPTIVRIFGYDSKEEFKALNVADLYQDPEDREKFNQKMLKTGVVRNEELELKKKDGTPFWGSVTAVATFNADGEVEHFDGIVEDITDRKREEMKINQFNKSLRLINKTMRHDIINNLQIVASSLELFREGGHEELLDKAFKRITGSIELIQKMRGIEILSVVGEEYTEYDVREVVDNILKEYSIESDVKGTCTVMADNALYSVIDNIVSNAVNHGETHKIDIAMEQLNDGCEIRIADYGRGIPDGIKEKVFEEHFSYGKSGGTGLGLHIVKQTVERYGGSICLEDNDPKGAVFIIKLREGTTDKRTRKSEEVMSDTNKKQGEAFATAIGWENIFQAFGQPVLITNPEHTIIAANQAAVSAVGKPDAEIIGKHCYDIFNEAAHLPAECPFATTSPPCDLEPEVVKIDIRGKAYHVTCMPVCDNMGTLDKIIHAMTDITNQKFTEAKLGESEVKYQLIFNTAVEGIITLNMKGTVLDVNPAFEKITGYDKEELMHKNVVALARLFELDTKKVLSMFKGFVIGKIDKSDWVINRKDGRKVDVIVFPSFIKKDGAKVGISVMISDITDRKVAEKALEANEEKYRRLFQESNDGIFIHDLEGAILDVNQRVLDLFGYTKAEITSLKIFELHPEAMLEKSREAFETISRDETVTFEIDFKKKNGEVFPAEVSSSLFYIRGKKVVQGIVRDITDRKKLEIEREARLADIEFLAGTAMQLVELSPEENLYGYIAATIKALTGDAIVVVSSFDILAQSQKVQAIEGIGKRISSVMKLLGKNPIGMAFKIHDPEKYGLYRGELKRISDDISGLTQGIIPKGMSRAIGKILGFGDIFSIDMAEREELLGNVTIILHKGAELENKKIIEAFVGQISVALQRKLAQDALRESETQYRNVVENAHDAIYIIHPEKGFQYVNPAFEDITGYTAGEIYADDFNFWNLIHPDDIRTIEERMQSRQHGKQISDRYEFRIVTKGGTTRIIEATTVDVGHSDDIMVMGILRDVTAREQAYRAMEGALALEKQFKADAAHFFLNPIAICRGYMDLAIERANEDIKDRLTLSIQALKRIESVIRNVVEKGQIRE